MPKGNREAKKPKKEKPKTTAAAASAKGTGAQRRSRICGLRREFNEPIEEPLNPASPPEAEFRAQTELDEEGQIVSKPNRHARYPPAPSRCFLPNALEQSAASIELRWDCHRSPH